MSDEYVSILLDIKSEVGALNARMMDASHSRERMEKSLDEVKETVAEIKPVMLDVALLKTRVTNLEKFEGNVSRYIWAGGVVVSAFLFFLWKGLDLFATDIKAWLGRMFH